MLIKLYPELHNWLILILLDDCNLLSSWQVMVLNSAIAKTENPVSYKLGCVENLYPTTLTLHPERLISDHDIRVVKLPSEELYKGGQLENDKAYFGLANQVCKIRLNRFYGEEIANIFEISSLLGYYDLEIALYERLVESEKYKEVKEFLEKSRSQSGKYLITTTWLKEKSIRPEEIIVYSDLNDIKKAQRRFRSKYLKKWNHAAAVGLMLEYNLDFPYWGLSVILYLGSGSIREILRIMAGMWDVAKLQAISFVKKSPLSHKVQMNGVKKASIVFFASLDTRPLSDSGP